MSFLIKKNDQPPKKRKRQGKDRANKAKRSYDDVMVVGYHCKLFQDDVMARYIEEGKHLIPWMGDESILVDRYDCRGYLYHQADFGISDGRNEVMSSDEQAVENECDKLRYQGLDSNGFNQTSFEEVEDKDAGLLVDGTSYANFSYDYGNGGDGDGDKEYDPTECYDSNNSDQETEVQKPLKLPQKFPQRSTPLENEELDLQLSYVKPVGLEIPNGMDVPDSRKSHSIIEKTALFISKHGAQMEIILKAKQAGNCQFDFLNFGNWLNPYYRFILAKIKDGTYTVDEKAKSEDDAKESLQASENESGEESGGESGEEYIHPLLQAHRRPVKTQAETSAYNKNEHAINTTLASSAAWVASSVPQKALPHKVYGNVADLYMARKYENVRRDIADKQHTTKSENTTEDNWADLLEEDKSFQMRGSQHFSSISEAEKQNIYATFGMMQFLQPPPPPPSESTASNHNRSTGSKSTLPAPPPPPGCGTEDLMNEESDFLHHQQQQPQQYQQQQPLEEHIVPPPPDLKLVVDKLAEYVSRNGEDFEKQIGQKKDSRFDFLNSQNVYYPYYLFKKQQFILEINSSKIKPEKDLVKKTGKPLSFSLKPKKKSQASDNKLKSVEIFKSAQNGSDDEVDVETKDISDGYRPNMVKRGAMKKELTMEEKAKAAMEKAKLMIAESQRKHQELKRGQELSVNDENETQIQMERRRKAAAFIGMLKKVHENNSFSSSSESSSDEEEMQINEMTGEESSKPARHFHETKMDD